MQEVILHEIWDLKMRGGIKISSLKELMDFKKAVDEELVLTTSGIDKKTPCIEIYDDYRE